MGEPVIAADPDLGISNLPDYLGSYGLRGLPFDVAVDKFYPGHGRQNLKDQLLHLLHFSDAPTLVTGPAGSGKSVMIAALASELSGEDHCFIPTPDCYTSGSALFFALARHIGLAVEPEASLPELQAKLIEWADFSGGNLQVFILIDDAQQLASDAARQLLKLVGREHENNCWHLLMCAEPDWQLRMEPGASESFQIFTMPEISASFVSDYLAFRLAAVGYDDAPLFDEAEEEQLWLDCGGDLNLLHRLAEQQMAVKIVQTGSERQSALPWLHIGALGLLLAILATAWIWQGAESPQDLPQAAAPVLAPAPLAQPTPEPEAEAEPEPAVPTVIAQAAPVLSPAQDARAQANETIGIASTAPVDPLSYSGGLSRPDADSPTPEATPVPAVKPEVRPAAASKHSADERWLLALSPERYVIQVLAAASEKGVQEFVAANAGLGLRVYRSERGGKPWYVVVQPDFSSQAAARVAIQKLPKKIRDSGPWPRSVAEVQQQMVPKS